MPYCVQCGVELPPDASVCPLCGTSVLLPPDSHSTGTEGSRAAESEPMFPVPVASDGRNRWGLDKKRKGALELLFGLSFVALAVLGFSLVPSGADWFVPMSSVVAGTLYGAVLLAFPFSYRWIATGWISISFLFIGMLGVHLGGYGWTILTCSALALGWILLVLPYFLPVRKRPLVLTIQFPTILAFLSLVDYRSSGSSWFLPVALPVACLIVLSFSVLALRVRIFRYGDFPMADFILSFGCIACLAVGTGEVLAVRHATGVWAFGWSGPLWIAASALAVFLGAVGLSRRVRRYFTSQTRHS